MPFLIPLVIAIALGAAVNVSFMVYQPTASIVQHKRLQAAAKGFERLETAVTSYLDFNRDAEGVPHYPGDGHDIESELFPAYGFKPSSRYELQWQVGAGHYLEMPSIGICLSAPNDFAAGLIKLANSLPQDSATLGSACYSTETLSEGNSLTYWIPLDHL